jgi:hypothetical protein
VVDRGDADFLARFLLATDVERRGLVLADEHGREADRARERLDLLGHLGPNPRRQRLAVHEGRSHGRGAYPTAGMIEP